jgi:hypothetical protein
MKNSSDWHWCIRLWHVSLVSGQTARGLLLTRVVAGKREYRQLTEREELRNFHGY